MEANPVQAAILTSDFIVNITSGSLAGTQASGSLSFDDSTLTGEELESVGQTDGLSIAFDFLGRSYTELNEYDREGEEGDYPLVSFQDGRLLGLNFLVINPSVGFAFSDNQIDNRFGTIGEAGGTTFVYNTVLEDWPPFEGQGVVTYSKPVPEPSSVLGTVAFGIFGTGLLLKRMKKKVANKTVTL